jgi:hypothetical protein
LVQQAGAHRGDLVLDRPPSQLVAEYDVATLCQQHACSEALVDVIRSRLAQPLEEPSFDPPRHDRRGVENLPSRRGQPGRPGEYGKQNARRQRPGRCGECLGDEERVSTGEGVDVIGGRSTRFGELANGVDRQRLEPDPGRPTGPRQVAECLAQRMAGADLVLAVRHDQQQREIDGPPAEHGDEVDRGDVRPVRVLDHEQHRPVRPNTGDKVAEQGVPVGGRLDAERRRRVDEGTESPRCAEGVAAPEDSEHASVYTAAEVLDQGGLADPGLTAELRLTLEQLPHGRGCNTIAVQSGSICSGGRQRIRSRSGN